MTHLRDPWKVAAGLLALIVALALLFPQARHSTKKETSDLPDPRTPPNGFVEHVLIEPAVVQCIRPSTGAVQDNCRMLGAEGSMVYHLYIRWDFSALPHRDGALAVQDARLELRENHEEQYEGPIAIRPVSNPSNPVADLSTPEVATGARISTRTFQAPHPSASPPFDELVSAWVNGTQPNHGMLVTADPSSDSSVDEFTLSLSFFHTAPPEQ